MSVVVCNRHAMFGSALATALAGHGVTVCATTVEPGDLAGLVRRHGAGVVIVDHGTATAGGFTPTRSGLLGEGSTARVVVLTSAGTPALWQALETGEVHALLGTGCQTVDVVEAVRRVRAGDRVAVGVARPSPEVPLQRRVRLAVPTLTRREHEVLQLMAQGLSTSEMASVLVVSPNTVRSHVQAVFRKLQANHRTLAVRRGIDLGLISGAAQASPALGVR